MMKRFSTNSFMRFISALFNRSAYHDIRRPLLLLNLLFRILNESFNVKQLIVWLTHFSVLLINELTCFGVIGFLINWFTVDDFF